MAALDASIEVVDPHFAELVGSGKLEQHWTGGAWTEGPVYIPASGDSAAGYVLWSDIPNNRMMRWDEATGAVTEFRKPSHFTNGHNRDLQGRLVSCEHGRRCISRTEADGSVTILVDKWEGKRLNSPNDLVVKSDGSIWFTDPPYGILSNHEGYKAESEIGKCFVYRFDPVSHQLTPVVTSMEHPNGLAFSLDEKFLYVSDTSKAVSEQVAGLVGNHHILRFEVSADGQSVTNDANPDVFVVMNPGLSDGFRVDTEGNVWSSSGDGIHCYNSAGHLLGKIHLPNKTSNCVFGGADRRRLFITCSDALYSITLNAQGCVKL